MSEGMQQWDSEVNEEVGTAILTYEDISQDLKVRKQPL